MKYCSRTPRSTKRPAIRLSSWLHDLSVPHLGTQLYCCCCLPLSACCVPALRLIFGALHISTFIRSISRFRNSGNSLLQKRVRQLPCATNHRGTEGSSATHAVITLNLGTRLSGVLGRHSRGWFRFRVWCHDPQQLNEGCLGRPDCLRRHQSCGGQ